MKKAPPVLNLTTSNHQVHSYTDTTSPASSIPSSIPTISSLPITPDTSALPEYIAFIDPEDGFLTFTHDQLHHALRSAGDSLDSKVAAIDSPSRSTPDRQNWFASLDSRREDRVPLRNFPATNFLSALSETTDRESIYSQDSACVVFTPKLHGAEAPPKSALTFAAIWDPDNGMSTYTGNGLLDRASKPLMADVDDSDTIRPEKSDRYNSDYYSFVSDLDFHGHPDCEPHLPSRFSTTTTSTSNYIDVDFDCTDRLADPNFDPLQPQPGDLHPGWVPQIFTLGYVKPSTPKRPKRPEISEPFQLTSSLFARRPTINRVASPPLSPRFSHADPRGRPVFPRSHTSSSSHSDMKTGSGSLRRGFSFGSSNSHKSSDSSSSISPTIDADSQSRPTSPTSRPRFTSVLGRIKSQKKYSPEEGWVVVDVTSVIRQRIVRENK